MKKTTTTTMMLMMKALQENNFNKHFNLHLLSEKKSIRTIDISALAMVGYLKGVIRA